VTDDGGLPQASLNQPPSFIDRQAPLFLSEQGRSCF